MASREPAEWRVSALADRTAVPAPGADGGHDGAPGEVSVDGEPLPTKRLTRLAPDARVRLDLPGGGGVGDPRERDPQAVLRDVVDGYVSIEAARELYGVRIKQNREGRVLLPEDFEIVEEQA
jgi:N-methylhydantoinase B